MIHRSGKWLKKQSLAFKISLGVLICLSLGVITLLSVVTRRSETIIEEQIVKHSLHTIKAFVDNISHLVIETEQSVNSLRNTLNQLEADDTDAIEIALKSTIRSIHDSGLDLSHVAIYTLSPEDMVSGRFHSAYAIDDKFFYKNEEVQNFYELFPWLRDIKKEEIVWSEPYTSPNSPQHKKVITCALPFWFEGGNVLNGIVSISIDVEDIRQYVDKSPFQDDGTFMLLSKKGLYVTHPDPDINLKITIYKLAEKLGNPKLHEVGLKMLSGQSGYVEMPFSSVYNGPSAFFYAPVPRLNWGVSLIYPTKQLFKPVYDLQVMIIISALIGIFILLLLINKICHYSTRPLNRLAKIATQYGKGDFSESVSSEIQSEDEIGTLSAAFNNMRTNLLTYIEKETTSAIEKQKDLSELEIAKKIQLSSVPMVFPKHKLFDIYALMIPARQIGGDFYDFFFLSEHKLALVMADVSGKGISAALYMMRAQEVIKHTAQYTQSAAEIFEQANNILCRGNNVCMFVTAFLALIDLQTGEMEYVNAGHLPQFIIEGNKCKKLATERNFVLGARENLTYKAEKITLKPNSFLFLYTDGITEAQNLKNEFYGEERLYQILQKKQDAPLGMVQDIIQDIRQFAEGAPQSDDITMLSFFYPKQSVRELTVNADTKELGRVLQYIHDDMAQKKIKETISAKMIMIAEELFSNIALYAYQADGSVRIETTKQKGKYYLTLADKGMPYNPLEQQKPDMSRPLTDRPIGGLGIFIAKELADSIEYTYENEENVLKVGVSVNG